MTKYAAFNLNMDSLTWASYPLRRISFKDPTFFTIADRFLDMSLKYNFKYTFFVIGNDLNNPEVASRVRDWHAQGHEIANHSYTHPQNLGSLPFSQIEWEVLKAHEKITQVCGEEPKGFIAPCWSLSKNLLKILIKHRYLYDTSFFPSYLIWFALAKLFWNFRKDSRRLEFLQRKDICVNLIGKRVPFFTDGSSLLNPKQEGLIIFPFPVTPFLRIPCWHTLSFFLPGSLYPRILEKTLGLRYFYYLAHPADLADSQDILDPHFLKRPFWERMHIPLHKKIELMERSMATIQAQDVQWITLKEMAKIFSEEKKRERTKI